MMIIYMEVIDHIVVEDAAAIIIIDLVATITTIMTAMIIPTGTTHAMTTIIVNILEASLARFLNIRTLQ
jgi:hypothetical protein